MRNQINPRVLRRAIGEYKLHGDMERVIHAIVKEAKTCGLYACEYERPDKYFEEPANAGKPGGRHKYPFWKMDVGETVILKEVKAVTVSAAASAYGRNHNMKFSVRDEGDDRVAVWRMA